jgi:AIPR protein
MDRITTGLLGEFVKEFELDALPEDKQFEHFASYVTVRRHYSETAFHSSELVTGDGGDTGIDGIAIIVNNSLVTDVDDIQELLDTNGYLDVTFVFVQAERSSNFESAKIGTFGFGVRDFFGSGKLVKNDQIKTLVAIMNALFDRSAKFTKGNPTVIMYYVTTGRWQNDQNLMVRYQAEVHDLEETGNFRSVTFVPVGADYLQKLYNQTKNAITREFIFDQKTVIPNVNNVQQAYLGYMAGKDFLKIVCDENDGLIESLFYENVRGWEGYNTINSEIRATLLSNDSDRFVLMNNGITVIARSLLTTGNKFTMSDFQIVNGCQTSNVLFDNRDVVKDGVRVPIRIIATTDDGVIESIITATNRQTEVKQEQFFALRDFAKKLEAYFRAFEPAHRIFYERRAHQYDSQTWTGIGLSFTKTLSGPLEACSFNNLIERYVDIKI